MPRCSPQKKEQEKEKIEKRKMCGNSADEKKASLASCNIPRQDYLENYSFRLPSMKFVEHCTGIAVQNSFIRNIRHLITTKLFFVFHTNERNKTETKIHITPCYFSPLSEIPGSIELLENSLTYEGVQWRKIVECITAFQLGWLNDDWLNDDLSSKDLFIGLPFVSFVSCCQCMYIFSFGFESKIWDLLFGISLGRFLKYLY